MEEGLSIVQICGIYQFAVSCVEVLRAPNAPTCSVRCAFLVAALPIRLSRRRDDPVRPHFIKSSTGDRVATQRTLPPFDGSTPTCQSRDARSLWLRYAPRKALITMARSSPRRVAPQFSTQQLERSLEPWSTWVDYSPGALRNPTLPPTRAILWRTSMQAWPRQSIDRLQQLSSTRFFSTSAVCQLHILREHTDDVSRSSIHLPRRRCSICHGAT